MEIAVKATYAHLVKDESLVQNSDKLYIVEFRFDQSWDGYAKSAVFEAGGVQQPPVALTDDRCIIPAECLKRAGINLKIGVSGIKDGVQKDTVWCLASKIMYALDPTQLMPPTHIDGDVKAQILEVIRENTATDAEVQEVLDNAFQSSWIPPEILRLRTIPPLTKRWRTFSMMFSAKSRKQIFLRRTYLCLSTLLSNS